MVETETEKERDKPCKYMSMHRHTTPTQIHNPTLSYLIFSILTCLTAPSSSCPPSLPLTLVQPIALVNRKHKNFLDDYCYSKV